MTKGFFHRRHQHRHNNLLVDNRCNRSHHSLVRLQNQALLHGLHHHHPITGIKFIMSIQHEPILNLNGNRGTYTRTTAASTNSNKLVRGGASGSRTRPYGPGGRPNLITGNSNSLGNSYAGDAHSSGNHLDGIASSIASEREVIVKDAYRQDTSVVIQWDSETNNILGFRVVYRLFGDANFQPGPPLDPSEREFKIKNVPAQVNFQRNPI